MVDISELLLTPQKPYKAEGGISDIGSRAYEKRLRQARWEALDTIYVELPRTSVRTYPTLQPLFQIPDGTRGKYLVWDMLDNLTTYWRKK